MLGFINRQLVETSQIIKLLSLKLDKKFKGTNIYCIKANISSSLQEKLNLYKCREANDYHHAHDAFVAVVIGRWINIMYPEIFSNPVRYAHQVKEFIKYNMNQPNGLKFLKGSPSHIVSGMTAKNIEDCIDANGEIIWDKEKQKEQISYIKKCFDYKDCYISRMPYICTDRFWKETIFSPRVTKGSIPIKYNRDVNKYGGYSQINYSFFFIYKRKKLKGNKNIELVFAGYPVSLLSYGIGRNQLLSYIDNFEDISKYCDFEIVYPVIKINQLFYYKNSAFYITGLKDIKNDKQIFYSNFEIKILENISNNKNNKKNNLNEISDQVLFNLFVKIKNWIIKNNLYLSKILQIDNYENQTFLHYLKSDNYDDRICALYSFLSLSILCKNGVRDDTYLPKIGLKNGRMNRNINSLIKDSSFSIIDKSVTGMFEKKTKNWDLELLS